MKTKTFEGALEKIEEIIEGLEGGTTSLKESIGEFKEGVELLKFCSKEIKEAEMSIQKVVDKDGKIQLEELK